MTGLAKLRRSISSTGERQQWAVRANFSGPETQA